MISQKEYMMDSSDIDAQPTTKPGFSWFLQSLSGYYSQFLETDFKATREPKRKYAEKQGQMRVGIQLSTYPRLQEKLISNLSAATSSSLKLKHGQYSAYLPKTIREGIKAAIRSVSNEELQNYLDAIRVKCLREQSKKIEDFESFSESVEREVHASIRNTIVNGVISVIKPVLEKQSGASAALEGLDSFSDEITSFLLEDVSETLLEGLGQLIFDKQADALSEVFSEIADEDQLRNKLQSYFEDFVAKDAFVELRDLLSTQQITENSQIYLNLGEVATSKSRFPLYYIPVDIDFEAGELSISLTAAIYANKKAIDFLLGQLNKNHQVISTNPLADRIFNKSPEETHFEVIFRSFHKVLAALHVEGDVDLKTSGKTQAERYGLKVSNSMTLTLFDKSDESIVNDYEQLMVGLDETDPLVNAFRSMIEAFLTDNPISVEHIIDKEWDETETPDRLVFQSPLPLAEEQRKVLASLRNPETKFVIVEGPPGTGKSHTITAIAFELILKGQNILILSDKKEALDVVEAKLNDVIGKVRGADIDYVNPILRLGKTDSNFSNIIKRASIDKLKTSVQQFKSNEKHFKSQYSGLESGLKDNVTNTVSAVGSIGFDEIEAFHKEESVLFDNFPELEDINEDSDGQLSLIADMQDLISHDRERLAAVGADKQAGMNYLALIPALRAISDSTVRLLQQYPQLDISQASELDNLVSAITSARNFLFGYLLAGPTLREIAKRVETITGRYYAKPQEQIEDFRSLAKIPHELQNVLTQHGSHSTQTSKFAEYARIGALNEQDATLVRKFLKTQFFEDVSSLLPTDIKGLLSTDRYISAMLSEVKALAAKRDALKTKFDAIPDFDYLRDKTQFEQMNTLKLVNQIDERVTNFATQYKADAKTLQQIIRAKAKFPLDKFDVLRQAFPCMIAGLRDFAEFIPLKSDLFDLVIIDEASQVSIAQAMPAILRAKQVIVLGDRRQFGNVKTANASKKINEGYFQQVMSTFKEEVAHGDISQEMRAKNFNIRHSVMDFFEFANNFTIQLKKHFRGYPEMISFSSKYVYPEGLQALKIRGKPIDDVLEFVQVPDPECYEKQKNVSEQEANLIFERIEALLDLDEPPSVAIITPFRDQVTYLSARVNDRPDHDELVKKLKLAIFTFDTCQGEERDVIFYSLVANRQADTLNYIFPRELKISEDEVDGNLKFQRLNVGFSRGKEKLVFVHSKPIDEYSGSIKRVLQHYSEVLKSAKAMPDQGDVDLNSPMEAQVLEWLKATSFVTRNADNIEIIPQFELGSYLKTLNPTYNHPAYKVDFLVRLSTEDGLHHAVIEYDGFEFHFDDRANVNAGNWQSYLTAGDVERECVLESFGYKMLRINRFNAGRDPIETLDQRLNSMFEQFSKSGEDHQMISTIKAKTEGIDSGELKTCAKCGQARPIASFRDQSLKSGIGRNCHACKQEAARTSTTRPKKRRRKR